MNKKIIKGITITISTIIFLAIFTGVFDYFRISKAEKPIFTIPVTQDDGGSGTYYGLGYKIELKGNFMPDVPIYGVKYVKYSVLGVAVDEIAFE